MSAAGRFANTMSTMLTAGLGVPRALDVTSQVVGNSPLSLGVRKVKENVERGRGIAESMAGVECFPRCSPRWWAWASARARCRRRSTSSAITSDSEVETQSTRSLSVLEPVITIVLAVIVVVLLAGGVPADVQYVRRHLIRYHFLRDHPARDDIERNGKGEIIMLKKLTNKKGFTLMEMLIVVAIIAVLVAIAIPTFNGALNKGQSGY